MDLVLIDLVGRLDEERVERLQKHFEVCAFLCCAVRQLEESAPLGWDRNLEAVSWRSSWNSRGRGYTEGRDFSC